MKRNIILILTLITLTLSACTGTTAPIAEPSATEALANEAKPNEAPTAEATAAEPAAEAGAGYVVNDALGREVRFDKIPERIVLAGRGVFMVADAIYMFPETSERLIAIAAMTQKSEAFLKMIDANYAQKQSFDRNAGAEQIAAFQPDCVVMKTTNAEMGDGLAALGIPVVFVDFETPEQYSRDLATLGQLFQNPERAQWLIDYFKNKLKGVLVETEQLSEEERPDTLLLYYNETDGEVAFNVAPKNWIQTMLVEMAGGRPVWGEAQLEKGWMKVTLEQIAAWNPEVIVVTAYSLNIPEVVQKLNADPQFQALEAVKNGKFYGMAADVYSFDQPDTRWIMGVEWLAELLHPDRFPNFILTDAAEEFYRELYGMDKTSFQQNILPILTGTVK